MNKHQIIHAPVAGELVVLTREDYDALLAAAGDPDAESRAVGRIVAASDAAIARGDEVLLPDWLAIATARGEPAIKVVRKHLDKTQTEVAAAAGITQGYLSDLERGTTRPRPDMVDRLAAALGVERAWLED